MVFALMMGEEEEDACAVLQTRKNEGQEGKEESGGAKINRPCISSSADAGGNYWNNEYRTVGPRREQRQEAARLIRKPFPRVLHLGALLHDLDSFYLHLNGFNWISPHPKRKGERAYCDLFTLLERNTD